jgi:hypothetical protein
MSDARLGSLAIEKMSETMFPREAPFFSRAWRNLPVHPRPFHTLMGPRVGP